jgi:hypothetical protein
MIVLEEVEENYSDIRLVSVAAGDYIFTCLTLRLRTGLIEIRRI